MPGPPQNIRADKWPIWRCETIFSYPLGGKAHIYINGHDLSEFRAKLESDYAISGCEIENYLNQGPSRSSRLLLRQNIGALTIRLPLNFYAGSKQDTMAHLSAFNALCRGTVEIDLSDGFSYTCCLMEIGQTAWLGDCFCAVDYTFSGIRHKAQVVLDGPAPLGFENGATFPRCDCVITLKRFQCTTAAPVILSLSDGSGTFLTWKIDTSGGLYNGGGDLVLDGIKKQNLYRGGNIPIGTMDYTDFPYLVPGKNTVRVSGGLTMANLRVSFIPAYL